MEAPTPMRCVRKVTGQAIIALHYVILYYIISGFQTGSGHKLYEEFIRLAEARLAQDTLDYV